MKKLFLMAAMASFGLTNALKAEDAAAPMVTETTTQIESVVTEIAPEVVIVEETVVETVKETPQPAIVATKPMVAVFYADWCGSCKILEPRMAAAMEQLADKDALKVVKFDLTDDTTKAASLAMAGENGLTDLYNDNAPKTGFAILVGGNAVEPVTLTKKDSIAEIKSKLETFIAASQS